MLKIESYWETPLVIIRLFFIEKDDVPCSMGKDIFPIYVIA
jgi:hypothetical protein